MHDHQCHTARRTLADNDDDGELAYTSPQIMFSNNSGAQSNLSNCPHLLTIVHRFSSEILWVSSSTFIALLIAYCVVIVTGLIGNILVIIVICRNKTLRSSRNFYILNLSVCDVIMCSICLPFSLVKLTLKNWTLGLWMCSLISALATVDVLVSTLTILVIALDRYLTIVHSSRLTTIHVVYVLLIIWAMSILLSTPFFCFHKIETQKMYERTLLQQCIDDWPDDLFREIYTTTVMLIQYLTPASVISFLNARICKFLHHRLEGKRGDKSPSSIKARKDLRKHKRNMVLLTAIALVFSLNWLPLTLLNVTADLSHQVFKESQYNLLHAIGLLVATSSSVANPIMYGWFNSNFRKAFRELLVCEKNKQTIGNRKVGKEEQVREKHLSKNQPLSRNRIRELLLSAKDYCQSCDPDNSGRLVERSGKFRKKSRGVPGPVHHVTELSSEKKLLGRSPEPGDPTPSEHRRLQGDQCLNFSSYRSVSHR